MYITQILSKIAEWRVKLSEQSSLVSNLRLRLKEQGEQATCEQELSNPEIQSYIRLFDCFFFLLFFQM